MIKAREKWKNKESTLKLFSPEQFPWKIFAVYSTSSSKISDLFYYWSILPMFIYSSISFALIVKENRSHKYSLKNFSSRTGELSVFSPQFSSQIQHFCYLSGSVWILPKLKTFPKRAKDKQIVRRLSFKWAPLDSKDRGFCWISYDLKII